MVGAAAVLGSLFGLTLPLSLQVVDRSGAPIACGTGFSPDHAIAGREDGVNRDLYNTFGAPYSVSDYTAQCDAAVATRRGISGSVLGFGVGLLGASVLVAFRAAGYLRFSRRRDGSRWTNGSFRHKAWARRSRATRLPGHAEQRFVRNTPPVAIRNRDDLNTALCNIGIRVQH
ncbi:hypothetical protein A5636_22195 [Mycobacterium asiaticum]|uniref:Uncharacterized protein n=1 Tax=Mycobacterium asiaticum TaxID=1790 RepID=A0A1A3NC13_MYCAS|nr:hypothetical protein A5636_22195 [Mycobacterium asiaticum]